MELTRLTETLADERLLANLIGVHALLAVILIFSFVVRKILLHGGDQLGRWTDIHWLEQVGKEANRRVRSLLFWVTLSSLTGALAAGIIYHLSGRDIRRDVLDWYHNLTGEQLLDLGITGGKLLLLAIGVHAACGIVRRVKRGLQARTLHVLQLTTRAEARGPDAIPLEQPASAAADADAERQYQEDTIRHWFFLLERLALATVFLAGVWLAGYVLSWRAVDAVVAFAMYLLAVVMLSRLATLACKTILHAVAKIGNRNLETRYFRLYWERVTRLFPFGQKCFEAAVYVYAASLCVAAFEGINQVDQSATTDSTKLGWGARIVSCIAIFFITRVLIELLQVLINEAFGMHNEEQTVDQKRQTLVPLLQSVSQYVIYFGSVVTMLGVLGVETGPILAGAGILGLAGGLGAQSLVTDLVSGFFILFENQYLVGDVVQIGDAQGRVEGVSIRTTHIRDENGKLHIIPNGQVKNVVSFSKGYVNAVVDFKVPTSTNLDQVMRDLADAGRRLRMQRREVLGETVIKGLVDLTPSDMVVRAVTRVQPGAHLVMQSEFRRHLKQIFDERSTKTPLAA
jgi:small-conductance mechanosensitive channel